MLRLSTLRVYVWTRCRPDRVETGTIIDEGMTNRPSIFAYLVFGPGGITVEGIARPIKTAA
jgi:hypothetical protein